MERSRALLVVPTLLMLLLFEYGCALNDEGKTLLKLKELIADDSSGDLSSWIDRGKEDENPCGWFGVGCENGKVVSLKLEEFCLGGKAAPLLANLAHLQYLMLRCYDFNDILPPEHHGIKILSGSQSGDFVSHGRILRITRVMANRKLLQKGVGDGQDQPRYMRLPPKLNSTSSSPPVRTPPSSPQATAPKSPTSRLDKKSPTAYSPSADGKGKNKLLYSLIGIVTGLVLIMLVIFLYRRYNKVVTVKPWATGLSGQLQKAFVTGVPVLKRQEIEAACEDFSNIIGSLRDCILYKGTLSSGVEIAVTSAIVKSSKDWSKHAEAQFKQKIATLSRLNHKNFVNLLGYCAQEEPFTRMMVFEYAPNGTLYDHLHNKELECPNWSSRLRIAMGIAYCLDHMHQLCPPIILKNLDSTLVHLTDDYAAKIADMELWSETVSADAEAEARESHTHTNQLLDQAGIVHQYGLILLEIVSGKATANEPSAGSSGWIDVLLSGKKALRDIIDPQLDAFQEENAEKIVNVIRCCLTSDPTARPKMKEVASQLREITSVHPEGAIPKLSPLWWAELEIISTEAN